MEFDYSTLEQKFQSLPDEVKLILTSPNVTQTIKNIADKHGLLLDQMESLFDLTSYVILGLLPPEKFVTTLVKEAEISVEEAREITEDINREILAQVKELVEKEKVKQEEESNILKAKLRSKEIIESTLRNTPNKINPVNSFAPREPVSHADLEKAGDFTIETENSFKQPTSSYKPYSPGYSTEPEPNIPPNPPTQNNIPISQAIPVPQKIETVPQKVANPVNSNVPEQPIVKAEIKPVAEPIVEPKLNIVEPELYKPSVAELNLNVTEPQPNLATTKETVIPLSLEPNDQKEPEQKVETPQVVQKKEWPKIIERPTIEKNIPEEMPPPSNTTVPYEQKQSETEVAQIQKQPATEIPQAQNQPITETSTSNVQTPPETPKAQVSPVQIKTRPYSIDPYREPVE